MKYVVKATRKINQRVGDRIFKNNKNGTRTLSAKGAEIALSPEMGGAYVLVSEIPETEAEKRRAAASAKKSAAAAQSLSAPTNADQSSETGGEPGETDDDTGDEPAQLPNDGTQTDESPAANQ